ncbi:MAG: tetratricopeptide repeat protein [Aeromonas sp.]
MPIKPLLLALAIGALLGCKPSTQVHTDWSQAPLTEVQHAAEQGNAAAQFNLGVMYAEGQGVAQDYQQAVAWYQKAAAQGNASAQFNLGVMYAKGQGVAQNNQQAYVWFSVAAANGDEEGAKMRDLAAKVLTPAGLAEGQRLATQYFAASQKK